MATYCVTTRDFLDLEHTGVTAIDAGGDLQLRGDDGGLIALYAEGSWQWIVRMGEG